MLDLLKYHLDHDNQEIIKVPSKAVPFIIGKNGSTIDRIKIESDCKIDLQKEGDSNGSESLIKLSGTKDSIKLADKLIKSIVKDFMEQDEQTVKVPESLLNTFKREYRKITQKYSKDDLIFYARDTHVKIKGKKESVQSAVKEINELVSAVESKQLIKKEILVPSRVHGKILGVEAANIKELTAEFDCDIQVPKFGQNGPVVLLGSPENVQKLTEKIESYCVEERLYKFPSVAAKNSFLASEKAQSILAPLKGWKQHAHGIILIGENETIEQVKKAIGNVE